MNPLSAWIKVLAPKKMTNSDNIKNAIILLHGYGGDGKDISTLSLNWKRHLPNTVFICPNGHESCPINPSGFQWFDLTKDDPNYIAIGAFFKSKTKKVNFIAKPSLISWAKRFTKLPVVIIGGITNKNFRKLMLHKPDFLAISGGIWNKKPTKAIKKFL